jgi:hypothetical protein
MKVSPQRALIALRSFPSVAAAARSISCKPGTLLRMTVDNEELAHAYSECVDGSVAARQREALAAERRAKPEPPRLTVRAAEKREARFFAAVGRNPHIAAAALHRRLNHEHRQEKAADIEAAIDAVDAVIADKPLAFIPAVNNVWDRWCAKCKEYRVDDPCEVCDRKTLVDAR